MRNFGQYRNQNYNFFGKINSFFSSKSMLSRLIAINIIIWLIAILVDVVYFLFKIDSPSTYSGITNHFVYWLSLPANTSDLLIRPWSPITYMFIHHQFFHIFFNMLVLYCAGIIFNKYFSDRQMLWTYIIGGLFGALFFIISYNIFPAFETQVYYAVAIGASASIMAILFAISSYAPNLDVNLWMLGNLKFKWIAVIFVIIDLLSITKGNAGGHIAHLGGALWGFVYGISMKNLPTLRNNFNIISNLKKKWNNIKNKQTFKKEEKERKNKLMQEEFEKKAREKRIDDILSKISRSGYSSLTAEEKEIIFSNSNNGKR